MLRAKSNSCAFGMLEGVVHSKETTMIRVCQVVPSLPVSRGNHWQTAIEAAPGGMRYPPQQLDVWNTTRLPRRRTREENFDKASRFKMVL